MATPETNAENNQTGQVPADLPGELLRPDRKHRFRISRKTALALALLIILALGWFLRGLSLSHFPGHSEARMITEVFCMEQEGSLSPPVSREGPLAHYCMLFLTLSGRTLGLVSSPEKNLAEWRETPPGASTAALRIARWTGLILGLLTILGVFFAGYHCGGLPGAITAGIAIAVSPLAVQQGRLLSPELASAAMVAMGVGFGTWAVRSGRLFPAGAGALFFGLSFGGRAYGALLFVPLILIFTDLIADNRTRFRHGLILSVVFGCGLLLSAIGRIADLSWWGEFLHQHLAGPARPAFGLEGEPTGWAFLLASTLPNGLGFFLSLTGIIGLFFGMRSGRFEWRFAFWSFGILFVVVGGVQDRTARSALPLVLLMAVGAGLFVASFWKKLKRHPGSAVLTLLVGLVLIYPLFSLVPQAGKLGRPDSRTLAREFLEEAKDNRGGAIELLTMLPLRTPPDMDLESPRSCQNSYPELAPPRFSSQSLCTINRRPVMNHLLWPLLEEMREKNGQRWDFYIWSSWADGVLEERGEQTYGGCLDAYKKVIKAGKKVAEFGGPTVEEESLRVEAAQRVIPGQWSNCPGPHIKIYQLRPPQTGAR